MTEGGSQENFTLCHKKSHFSKSPLFQFLFSQLASRTNTNEVRLFEGCGSLFSFRTSSQSNPLLANSKGGERLQKVMDQALSCPNTHGNYFTNFFASHASLENMLLHLRLSRNIFISSRFFGKCRSKKASLPLIKREKIGLWLMRICSLAEKEKKYLHLHNFWEQEKVCMCKVVLMLMQRTIGSWYSDSLTYLHTLKSNTALNNVKNVSL